MPDTNIGYDCTFELNEFNEPKLSSEIETIKNTLLFILFSKPGQYPSLPQIGIDINSYLYEFYDEIDTAELQQKLISQCSALGVYMSNGSINIRKAIYKNQPSLLITVSGIESFPNEYKCDRGAKNKNYLIGITYDEMKKMVYNINTI